MRTIQTICIPIAGLFCALNIGAQSNLDGPVPPAIATGNPVSSYQLSGVDHVNYFTGSLQIDVPLLKIAGRSDAVQNIVRPVGNHQWLVDPTTLAPMSGEDVSDSTSVYRIGGWVGFNSAFTTFNSSPCSNSMSPAYLNYVPSSPVLTWLTYNAPDQTETALADENSNGAVQPGTTDGCTSYDRGRVFHSYDGSGLTYISDQEIYDDVFGGYTGKLLLGDGTQYVFSLKGINNFVTIRDRNGNQASQQYATETGSYPCSDLGYSPNNTYTITDSAGRTETIDFTFYPKCLAHDTITFPGSTQSGVARTITVNYDLLQNRMGTGLPLGQNVQTPKCLFPLLYGSSSTSYNPYVISSIILPDGSSYSFLYDYYGEVMQMGLPAGGVIKYTWPMPSSCSDPGKVSGAVVWNGGTRASIYRRVQERDEYANGLSGGVTGKIVYTRTSLLTNADPNHPTRSSGYGTQLDADIQDGLGNQLRHETHWFYGDPSQSAAIPADPTSYPSWSDGLEYRTDILQGTVTRQSQQKLWQQQPCTSGCWFNPGDPPTPDTALRMNSPLVCQVNTTLDSSPASSVVTFYETAANNVIGSYEYDFGSAPAFGSTCPATAPGGSLRSTQYSYWFSNHSAYGPPTASAPSNVNLIHQPSYKIINGGSIEYFYYDETAPTLAAGAAGHDDADFGTSYRTRGNLTTHSIYQNMTSSPTETFTWDTTGRQLSHADFDSNSTTYTFGDTPHVYPTTITNALSQARSYSYDPNILQIRTATDENSAITTYNYNGDPLDRLTSVVRANGSQTAWTYDSSNPTHVTVKQDQNGIGVGELRADTFTDGLGRQTQSVAYETASTITTATAWDALGRVTSVSNPYRPGDIIYNTRYTYDLLNRTNCVTTDFDSAHTCTTYSGNSATVTDPAGNAKTLVSDAAGRVTSVTEDPGSAPHLNYATSYLYNVFDELTKVTQGAQTRTFSFDFRGRLTSAANPENGTTSYGYDNNNNLTSRTDNSGVTAAYTYDALNRISTVIYTGPRSAPSVVYFYDTGATNSVGRLVKVNNGWGTFQQITAYDALGRITGSSETVGGTAEGSFAYTYNLADALVSTTYPSGRVVTNAFDGANRISSLTGVLSGSSKTYLSNATYAASGAIGAFNYALTGGVAAGTRTFSYNGRMQPGEISDQGSSLLDLKYYYGTAATTLAAGSSTSANNGNPTGVVEKAQKGSGTAHTFTQAYGFDSLNRLSTASDTGGWAQNFSFDRYGNPWTTANSGLPSDRLPTSNVYTPATSQSTDAGVTYDSAGAGNQITMGSAQLTFDAENRIVQSYDTTTHNSTCFAYDALGERVYKKTYGGTSCITGTAATTVVYVYDAFGNLMRQVETVTVAGAQPPTPCLTCYVTWDHLGSVRMVSDTVSGGFTAFHDYAPFGGEVLNNAGRTSDWGTGTDYLSQRYTGAERDTETTLDFLQARYLANQQARFLSADPAGNAVADPTNPQSWNMYSYALSNPLAFIDPSGMEPACYQDGDWTSSDQSSCVAGGGKWLELPGVAQSLTINGDTDQVTYSVSFIDWSRFTANLLDNRNNFTNSPVPVQGPTFNKPAQPKPAKRPPPASCFLSAQYVVDNEDLWGKATTPRDPLVGNGIGRKYTTTGPPSAVGQLKSKSGREKFGGGGYGGGGAMPDGFAFLFDAAATQRECLEFIKSGN